MPDVDALDPDPDETQAHARSFCAGLQAPARERHTSHGRRRLMGAGRLRRLVRRKTFASNDATTFAESPREILCRVDSPETEKVSCF